MGDERFSLAKTPIFTTRQFAMLNEITLPAASKRLYTLKKQKRVERLTRGVWIIPDHPHFSLYGCVPHLLGNEAGYISFLSALHLHGSLSQIPKTIQIATTGHSRRLDTKFGSFEFFQLHPRMMRQGVLWSDTPQQFQIASLEKALLDTYYLATRKGRRFAKLPEIELPQTFKIRVFKDFAKTQIPWDRIRLAVLKRIIP